MKKVFSFILLLVSSVIYAQTPSSIWAKDSNGNSDETATCTATDLLGNVYVAGTFNGDSINIGGHVLHNQSGVPSTPDIFIAKYDIAGNVLWTKGIQGGGIDLANAITTDLNGNFYLTGFINILPDSVDFGGIFMTKDGLFLAKFDPNGNPIWLLNGGNGYGNSVSVDVNNNVYVAGGYYDTLKFGTHIIGNNYSGLPDIFVVKIDSSGNPLWLESAGGTDSSDNTDEATDVTSDLNGNVYISGSCASGGAIAFGSLSSYSGGFLAKYDSLGNALWVKPRPDSEPYRITVDASGNIYGGGSFVTTPMTYGAISLINHDGSGSTSDGLIIKYDPLGNVMWAKNVGGNLDDEIKSIKVDANNNIYLTGYFNSPLFYTTGSSTLTNTSSGSADVFIIKCDSLGNFIWGTSIGGASDDWGTGIAIDQNGFLNVAGYFESPSIGFGMDTLTNTGTPGTKDFFITKLSSSFVSDVWPGDANHDFTVDNTDLLPIGLYYGQTGFARSSVSNVWQADSSANWGLTQPNLSDLKHVDCNGDGIINMSDTLAVNLNFSSAHSIQSIDNTSRAPLPDMYFTFASSSYLPGDWVDAEVWLGTAANPVAGLYGLSFNIDYNTSLIEPGTTNMNYPNSWLGTPGTNAIKMAKLDPLASTIFGAETRIDHLNANGFGKIADFTFQVKNSITTPSLFYFSITAIKQMIQLDTICFLIHCLIPFLFTFPMQEWLTSAILIN